MPLHLVTGGAGFIGSHLCDALLARGDRVRVIDDLSTGKRGNLPAGVEFLEGDIADPQLVARAVEAVDGVFHLAAVASVQRANEDWAGTHRTNLTGTIVVFDAVARAQRAGPGRVIPVVYASSAAVYGDNPNVPLAESERPRPLSAYGADKLGCELHAVVAGHVHGVPSTGLRFFNVYGPRQDPSSPYSGVISIFADRLRRRQPATIFGDGGQTRDFVYVGDVVAALLAAAAKASRAAPVFNVCTGRPTSIRQLHDTLAGLTGANAPPDHGPARAGDIRRSVGNPARIGAELGWHAAVDLQAGLTRLLDAFA